MATSNDPYSEDPYSDPTPVDQSWFDQFLQSTMHGLGQSNVPAQPSAPPERSTFDEFLQTAVNTVENKLLPLQEPLSHLGVPKAEDLLTYGEKAGKTSTALEREPHGIIGKSLDLLQRTQFFSAKFADKLMEEGVAGIGDALIEAKNEAIHPKDRPRYADLIRKYAPEWSAANPFTAQTLGLAGDIGLDPLTYMDFAGGAIKLALGNKAIVLNKMGLRALETQQTMALRTIENARRVASVALSGPVAKEDAQFLDLALKSLDTGDLANADNALQTVSKKLFGNSLPADVKLVDALTDKLKKLELTPIRTARESAEKTLAKIYNSGGHFIEQKPAVYMKVPFGDFLKIPLTDKLFEAGSAALNPLKEWASKNRFMQQLALTQSRNHEIVNGKLMPIHDEVLNMRADYLNYVDELHQEVPTQTWHLFRELNKDSRKKILDLAYKVDDESRLAESKLGRQMTENEAVALRDSHIQPANLNAQEKAVLSRFTNDQYRQGLAEHEAGLLDSMITNYNYRTFEKVKWFDKFINAKKYDAYQKYRERGGGLSSYLGSSEARDFLTTKDAEAAGLKLEPEAMKVYALRLLQGKRALATEQFKQGLKNFYKVESLQDLNPTIRKDLAYIGDYNYSMMGSNETWLGMVRAFDKINNLFRFAAVPLRPYFATKQLLAQNPLQAYLANGVRAFKMFDPRVAIPAATLLWRHHGYIGDIPKLASIPLEMAKFTMRSGLGKPYEMEELYKNAVDLGMFKQAPGFSGDYDRTIEHTLKDFIFDRKFSGGSNAREGAVRLFRETTKFTNWASLAEEYSNLSTWLNGIVTGHSPRGAAEITNSALFDYRHGLTEFNKQWVRRFARPFFTWERFAAELVGKTLFKNPGRISNVNKAVQNLFEGWNKMHGGETLTDSERRVGDYILEQPSAFEKFDENQKAVFKVFQSFSPLDIGNGMAFDPVSKQLDISKTLGHNIIAGGAPFWKIGLEELINKNFFTDQVIRTRPGAKLGQGITPNELLQSVSTGLGAMGGTLPAILASFAGQLAGSNDKVQDAVKTALSWEEVPDPITGKNQVYINPWMAHVFLSQFPGLKTFIRASDKSQTPRERVVELMTGIKTTKIDLAQSYRIRISKQEQALKELDSEIYKLRRMGAIHAAEKAQKEYEVLLDTIMQDRAAIDPYDIRGAQ